LQQLRASIDQGLGPVNPAGEMYKAIATTMGVTNTSDYGDSALAPGPLTDILV